MGIIILPTCIRWFKFSLFISRSRAHSSESIDTRGASEVLEHQPFLSGVQPLQHMVTPSSTPHGTPHGTPSGFTIDGHSRKIKASSRRPLKQSTEYHIPREKEDQSKLEPVKQVLFPIGSAAEPSDENIPTQLKKMPALISLTTSPTYTALSLNSTTVSTTSTPTAGPGKKSSGGDVVNLIPILSSTSISSATGFVNVNVNAAGIAAHDAPPPLTISALKAKHIKSNEFGGGSYSKPPSQILPIGSSAGGYVSKLSAVSAMSSTHTNSTTTTSFGPAHTQSAESSAVPADSINIHHSKRLSRVLKSATAWAEESPQMTAYEIPAADGPNNEDLIASSNLTQEPTVTVDAVAESNDRILQERLQEAKSLSRRTDCGAVMHSFSLWSKKDNDSNKSCSNQDHVKHTGTSGATTSSSTTGSTPSHKNNSGSNTETNVPIDAFSQTFPTPTATNARLRGPKARVREFQLLHGVQQEIQLNPGEQGDLDSTPIRNSKASLDDNNKSQSGHRGLPNLLRSKVGDSKKGGEDKPTKPDDQRASKAHGSFTSRYRRILQTQDDDSLSSNDADTPSFEPVPALNSTYPNPTSHRSKQQQQQQHLHPIIYKGSLAFGTSAHPEKDSDMVVEDSVSVADEESVDVYEKSCYGNNSNTIAHFDNTGNMNMNMDENDDDDILSEMSDNDDINFSRNNNNHHHYNTTANRIRSRNEEPAAAAAADYFEKDSNVHPSSKMQQTVNNVCNVNKKTDCVSGDGAAQKKGT